MGNNKDSNKTRPGEMPPGKFHFNPGNMSGKKLETLNVTKMTLLYPWIKHPGRSNQKHRSKYRGGGRPLASSLAPIRECHANATHQLVEGFAGVLQAIGCQPV